LPHDRDGQDPEIPDARGDEEGTRPRRGEDRLVAIAAAATHAAALMVGTALTLPRRRDVGRVFRRFGLLRPGIAGGRRDLVEGRIFARQSRNRIADFAGIASAGAP